MKLVRSLAMVAALIAPVAWGQDVVPNGHFHVDVSGWTFAGGGQGTPEWSALDWQANPASGSLRVTNHAVLSGQLVSSRSECFPVSGPGTHELGAEIRIPSNQGASGGAAVWVDWFTNASCLNANAGFATVGFVFTQDVWNATLNDAIAIPAGAQSARVSALVGKTTEGGQLAAHFDRVRFGPLGTTPAELTAFEVE